MRQNIFKIPENLSRLIEQGFALVPITYGQKSPNLIGWNLRTNTVNTIEKISQLHGMNVGLAHAYCTTVPTCAIDIDDVKASEKWLHSQDIDLRDLQNAHDSVGIISGKPNSAKLIYKLPVNTEPLVSKSVVGPSGKMMIEFRCATKNGLTVQDVLPPSSHPSGSRYQWVGNGSIFNLPTIPTSLLAVWEKILTQDKKSKDLKSKANSFPETNRRIAILEQQLSYIDADCNYEVYRNVIWGIASTGWSCAYKKALDWSMTAEHRFEEHTLDALFNSYDSERENPITYGTIYRLARAGGYHE